MISVRLDSDFVADIKLLADKRNRSVPSQIKHLVLIGKMMEESNGKTYREILQGQEVPVIK